MTRTWNPPGASPSWFRMATGIALAGLVLVLLSACEPASAPAPILDHDGLALETEDPRFEIFLRPGPSRPGAHALRLRLEPKSGWHMTPEAPTRLELSAGPGIEFDSPRQSGNDAVLSSEEIIEFAIEYRLGDDYDASDGASSEPFAKSQLKFGVCRNDNPRCEIVKREFEIPLAVH